MRLTSQAVSLVHAFSYAVRRAAAHSIPMRSSLAKLVRAGYLTRERHVVSTLPDMCEPLHRWPDDGPVDARSVSRIGFGRWTSVPQPTTIYSLSKKGATLLGGRVPKAACAGDDLPHDLCVAAVFFSLTAGEQELWTGEDCYPKELRSRWERVPDALLVDSKGKVLEAHEIVGRYRPEQIDAFCRFCEQNQLRYCLW